MRKHGKSNYVIFIFIEDMQINEIYNILLQILSLPMPFTSYQNRSK
jgi:hypothetical protein